MNCSKYIPPQQIYVNIYYYYSYFTLILSLLITPIQFYIIITKSKDLKNLKWLILNHSFWSLAFEIYFSTVKPFFVAPGLGGFPLGLFRNGNTSDTMISSCIGGLIFLALSTALVMTIIGRYLYAFPSKLTDLINMKYIFMFTVFVFFGIILLCTFLLFPNFSFDHSEAYKAAIEYDPCLQIYFTKSALIFFPISKNTFFYLYIAFFGCCTGSCSLIFILFFFIFSVFSNKTTNIAKLHKSLIISAIGQIFILFLFIFFPVFLFLLILCFQIHNFSNMIQILCCIISSHSFLESFATLYFVTPYRKAVKNFFQDLFYAFKFSPNRIQIFHTSSISLRN